MTDQVEKLVNIIDHVAVIQEQLDHLVKRLRHVKEEVETLRSPPASLSIPAHFADETPHFGMII